MRSFSILAFLALALSGAAFAEQPFSIETVALDKGSPALSGPFIALVWKSDCAPCLTELSYLARLQDASGGRMVTVSLDAAELARTTLAENGVPPHAAYAAAGDPSTILADLSGGATRLPLSVAVNAAGEICASHVGLLGTDQARAWVATCLR